MYHGIDETRWATWLVPQLSGKAREAYSALPVDNLSDYKVIKAAILARYKLNAEAYRQKFRTENKNKNENYSEWGVKVHHLLDKWVETAGIEDTAGMKELPLNKF